VVYSRRRRHPPQAAAMTTGGQAKELALRRPKDDSTPLADADPDFYLLFQALSIPAIMVVVRGLLSECRFIFISAVRTKGVRLSSVHPLFHTKLDRH
jgi:hypothetical protein